VLQAKTHFEQIPLEIVKKIAEEEIRAEKAAGEDPPMNKETEKRSNPRRRRPASRGYGL
jgi:hypothetical protein